MKTTKTILLIVLAMFSLKILAQDSSKTIVRSAFKVVDNGYPGSTELIREGLSDAAHENFEMAIKKFTQVILLFPKLKMECPSLAIVYYNRGIAYSNIGKDVAAIKDFTKAIELAPNEIYLYYNRGLAYIFTGKYEMAVSDFSKVIEMNTQEDSAYYNRGLAYYYLGENEEAILDFSFTIALSPNFAAAYYNRGLTKNIVKKGDGCTDLRRAFELGYKEGMKDDYARCFR